MSARQKLNAANLTGAAMVSGFLGLCFSSWGVFWIALIVMLIAGCQSGGIRFGDHRSRASR